jgi:hypothetical protein
MPDWVAASCHRWARLAWRRLAALRVRAGASGVGEGNRFCTSSKKAASVTLVLIIRSASASKAST